MKVINITDRIFEKDVKDIKRMFYQYGIPMTAHIEQRIREKLTEAKNKNNLGG